MNRHQLKIGLCLVFWSICNVATAMADENETEFLQQKINSMRPSPTDDYPYPAASIQRIAAIENELTPSKKGTSYIRLAPENDRFCTKSSIEIYYQLDDQSPLESFTAILRKPRWGIGLFPVIVIQPTLVGPGELENTGIAQPLCRNGFASIVPTTTILDLPAKLPDLQAYDRNLRTEMIRARRMVDLVQADSSLDHNKIGVIGFSRGAIAGALLIGIEPRVKYAFLGAGGVGIGRIIARSQTEKGKSDNEAQIMALSALNGKLVSSDEFENLLVRNITFDGILFAHRFDPKHLKLMIVDNDDNVGTENQNLMYRAFCRGEVCPLTVAGQPNILPTYLNGLVEGISGGKLGTHVSSIVNLVFVRPAEFIDFFKDQTK